MSAYFVTATGTDIGKTFVTAGLIRALRRAGRPVDALKPVISGFDPKSVAASDTGVLLAALERPFVPEAVAHLSPWRFSVPLSPDMAAAREGRSVDFDALTAFCRERIAAATGTLLIEGVGGVMAPLDERHTVLDWIAALDIPILLVAGSYLGTISHTLSALEVLKSRGLRVKSVIVSETEGSTVNLDETAASIRRFAGNLNVVAVRRLPDDRSSHAVFDSIAAGL